MAPDLDPNSWDHSELEKYGLGKVRSLDLFYKLFLINPVERKAIQLCPFVKTGIMHNEFQKYLRSDGLGIDYTQLVNFDTASKIEGQLVKQHPYWERKIRENMVTMNKKDLQEAIANAIRVRLDKKLPDLIRSAQDALQNM